MNTAPRPDEHVTTGYYTGTQRGQVTRGSTGNPFLISSFHSFITNQMSGLESFTLWSALPPELRFFIMLFVDFDTQETCIITNKETRLWTIAVRKSRRETVIKRIFNKQQSEQQSASIVFAAQAEAAMVDRRCSAQIRLQAVLY